MTDSIEITPATGPIEGTIRPPGSKSITNRAFILAALAEGRSKLTGVLDSEDTRVMSRALQQLGFEVETDFDAAEAAVVGQGGIIPNDEATISVENSGTSIRFLTALCALGQGPYKLDGIERMRERPIGDLSDALNQLGADVKSTIQNGFPPVEIRGASSFGGQTQIAGNMSSQFLSALLMVAPRCESEVVIDVRGELVSKPYVHMTLNMMKSFGLTETGDSLTQFRFAHQPYIAREYAIEPDASAASYFFGAAAVTGGRVSVEGLSRQALQGDIGFVDVLEQMGCEVTESDNTITVCAPSRLRGIEVDMNAISDTAQTLACVAALADSPTTIRNIEHVRHKETDRISAVCAELNRLGIKTSEFLDGLRIEPGPIGSGKVRTYNDHRMAMSFSLIGLRVPGVHILDPACTGKTYPHYFRDLNSLYLD